MTATNRVDEAQAQAMVETMASMQDRHNVHVHAHWRTQGYEYYRAIWVECAELLDHFGWKWWKQQYPDLAQVKLEVVDIWHFGLSDLLRDGRLDGRVALDLQVTASAGDPERFRLAVETFAQHTLVERRFDVEPFAAVMTTLPLGFAELFELYVGKNVLNNFRQDHGYKTGEYAKVWDGREDNEHLIEALAGLECAPEAVPEQLYAELDHRYPG